ncbi:hypothetical protein SLA_2545 [Streptomyces laurentii]|uniref:Uncharacterized protein n=1 Tax=Streptomyces laurentii TaxID=39478 RepID=A0A160NZK8_STRLU|nr:hypothetical protein SLA_2545 [Streptomyces laurentii]
MRPQRFSDLMLDLAKNEPTASRVQTLTKAGDTEHPFGLTITLASGESRWQFTGQLPGEAWLVAVLATAECPEIKAIERWSTRATTGGRKGLTATFHNGVRIFARRSQTPRAARDLTPTPV